VIHFVIAIAGYRMTDRECNEDIIREELRVAGINTVIKND
jgi:hypothetical protein